MAIFTALMLMGLTSSLLFGVSATDLIMFATVAPLSRLWGIVQYLPAVAERRLPEVVTQFPLPFEASRDSRLVLGQHHAVLSPSSVRFHPGPDEIRVPSGGV
jgi:hypothetical protein